MSPGKLHPALLSSVTDVGNRPPNDDGPSLPSDSDDSPLVQEANADPGATTLYISDPPYENYFYSDSNVAAHLVVTSPLPESDLRIIGPRVVVAWPAGNSGACMFFEPEDGVNGTLGIKFVNTTVGSPLAPVYIDRDGYPDVGIKGVIQFSKTATLSLSILGSVRAVRDFTEGPSLLNP